MGTTTETTIPWHQHCATARGEQYALPKLQIIRVYSPKLFGTAGERKKEREKGRQHRQQFRGTNIVPRQERNNMHYQNYSLLEYINQNYLERYITKTYWNGEWSK